MANLAVRVMDAPANLTLGLWRASQEPVIGAIALVADAREYRTCAELRRHAEHAATIARAAGGRYPAQNFVDIEKEQARRTRRLYAALVGVALLVFAASISAYSPLPWVYAAPAATLALLFLGRYYRAGWLTALSPAGLLLLPFGVESMRWWPVAGLGVLLLLLCEYRGTQVRAPSSDTPQTRGLRRSDWKVLWTETHGTLLARGKSSSRTDTARPLSRDGVEVGVAFGVRCVDGISPDDVRAIEREHGFPTNTSSYVGDPQRAGSGELRLVWGDPLPARVAPRREPMSLTYASVFTVAEREGHLVTEIGLARTRVLLAGSSGTGKSQALQNLLDATCDMTDVRWSGIDLQEGPTLKAYAKQWNCHSVHYTRASAVAHLREVRQWCIERNRRLDEGMDADLDGEIDQWWIVSEDRPGHVLYIEELSSLTTDKEAREELVLLLEVCRKASVSVVMATPDLDSNRVGPVPRDQANIKVAFGCPFSDSQLMFGKGSSQSGWEPWSFVPADLTSDNDAGKSYLLGAGYNLPEVHRWYKMPKDEIVARNKARRLWRERFAPEPIVVEAEIVDPTVEAVKAALGLCGLRQGLPVAEASNGLTAESVILLRAVAPPKPVYLAESRKNVRCFPFALLSAYLETHK